MVLMQEDWRDCDCRNTQISLTMGRHARGSVPRSLRILIADQLVNTETLGQTTSASAKPAGTFPGPDFLVLDMFSFSLVREGSVSHECAYGRQLVTVWYDWWSMSKA